MGILQWLINIPFAELYIVLFEIAHFIVDLIKFQPSDQITNMKRVRFMEINFLGVVGRPTSDRIHVKTDNPDGNDKIKKGVLHQCPSKQKSCLKNTLCGCQLDRFHT